jgi:Arc/MetJ-type ribon-helix-helix transcriptional regulator
MESITIKIEENIAKKINESIKLNGYSTKTEFIREAIRDKLEKHEKEILIKEFLKFKGKSNTKTNYGDNKKTREEVSKQLAKEFGISI